MLPNTVCLTSDKKNFNWDKVIAGIRKAWPEFDSLPKKKIVVEFSAKFWYEWKGHTFDFTRHTSKYLAKWWYLWWRPDRHSSCRCISIITVMFNSLTPGRPGCHFKTAIFNLVLLIRIFTSSNDNALRWMPWHLTDDKSTLVQVMALCRQVTSYYLSQCWPGSMSPYGVTRPQWVNTCCAEFILRT